MQSVSCILFYSLILHIHVVIFNKHKKTRNINQLHINTFTYQKKLRTFKTKTANIYQCFFSRHKQGWIPYHIQLYIFYIMIWSQIWNIESFNLYVCTFRNTYKKEKFQDSNMLCNFKRYKKARVSSVHCFGAEVYSLKKWFLWYLWHG